MRVYMKWTHPPIIKIYEALGAVADGRVEVEGTTAKVYSSSRSKYYDVAYEPNAKAIMANDNGSYWKGYLGYPAIAYLMTIGALSYDHNIGDLLKGIAWKDINQQFKNDFEKTLGHILSSKTEDEKRALEEFVQEVDKEIRELNIAVLGKK